MQRCSRKPDKQEGKECWPWRFRIIDRILRLMIRLLIRKERRVGCRLLRHPLQRRCVRRVSQLLGEMRGLEPTSPIVLVYESESKLILKNPASCMVIKLECYSSTMDFEEFVTRPRECIHHRCRAQSELRRG